MIVVRERVSLLVPIIAAVAFGGSTVALRLGDSDVFWHLATARDALAHGVVRADLFSWTVAGQPVSTDQWLGQLLWYGAYLAGGWTGILALRTITATVLVGILVWSALRERPGAPLAALLAALPAIILTRFISVERPELFGFVCFAILVPLLRSARAGNRRALAALPILIAVWANLHGSFALGLALVLVVATQGALRDEAVRRHGYLVMAGAATLATLLTPAGIGVWTAPGFHLLHPPRFIQEWAVPDVTTLPGLVFAATIVLTFATASLAPTRERRAALVLLPVLLISLTAVRQTPYFAIAAAPFLALHGPGALAAILPARPPRRHSTAPPGSRIDLFAGLIAFTALTATVAVTPAAPDLAGYPSGALPALTAGPGLLNDYDWGGYLIWSAPRTPVFIDGRLIPYLPAVLTEYNTVVEARAGWRETLARRGVRQLLVRPHAPVAVRAQELGWPVRFLDATTVLIAVPTVP